MLFLVAEAEKHHFVLEGRSTLTRLGVDSRVSPNARKCVVPHPEPLVIMGLSVSGYN